MTRSHAKNNTSGSVFTYYERNRTEFGSKRQRIGADSMKKVDSCNLCLAKARGPVVACEQGHLFCKECILSSLISQKSLLKSQKLAIQEFTDREAAEKLEARARARARVLSDFQRGIGLGYGSGAQGQEPKAMITVAGDEKERMEREKAKVNERNGSTSTALIIREDEPSSPRGLKRKFTLDSTHIEKLALVAEQSALLELEKEHAEKRKVKLPSFWLPTLTPESKMGLGDVGGRGILKKEVEGTVCNVAEHPHSLSAKNLFPVIFTYPHSTTTSTSTSTPKSIDTSTASTAINPSSSHTPICPSCSKEINNSTSVYLLSSKTSSSTGGDEETKGKKSKKGKGGKEEYICGHVVCGTCAETIVKPGKQCVVCEAIVDPVTGVIQLGKDGTGYAAAGGAEATRQGVAFQ